jgi:hypothetical protein
MSVSRTFVIVMLGLAAGLDGDWMSVGPEAMTAPYRYGQTLVGGTDGA